MFHLLPLARKAALIAVLLAWPARAPAAAAVELPAAVPCPVEVARQLARWRAAPDLRRVAEGDSESARYIAATSQLGVWLDLRVSRQGGVALARVSSDRIIESTWDRQCLSTLRERAAGVVTSSAAGALTDAELERHLAVSRAVLVYVWSPHMPLSVDGLAHAAAVAQRLQITFLPAVDPRAERSYVDRVARDAGLPEAATRAAMSVELVFRDLLVHAPSVLVYVDGRAAGPAIPGFRDVAGYERIIRERMAFEERR